MTNRKAKTVISIFLAIMCCVCLDRKSTRLNPVTDQSRMPSSA